ncbi:hypothetical protein BLOT_009456 [Blomia tropicalis]|nr:hypothetical protein BLOT_009456 [Blomia tropicalis]
MHTLQCIELTFLFKQITYASLSTSGLVLMEPKKKRLKNFSVRHMESTCSVSYLTNKSFLIWINKMKKKKKKKKNK